MALLDVVVRSASNHAFGVINTIDGVTRVPAGTLLQGYQTEGANFISTYQDTLDWMREHDAVDAGGRLLLDVEFVTPAAAANVILGKLEDWCDEAEIPFQLDPSIKQRRRFKWTGVKVRIYKPEVAAAEAKAHADSLAAE